MAPITRNSSFYTFDSLSTAILTFPLRATLYLTYKLFVLGTTEQQNCIIQGWLEVQNRKGEKE